MSKFNQDHTFAVIAGIPIFCVNREYRVNPGSIPPVLVQYIFRFQNTYGASIVELAQKSMHGQDRYELAVLDYHGDITRSTMVTSDIERGSEFDMDQLLHAIEALA